MLERGMLWLVVADGRRARVWAQAQRSEDLEERLDLAAQLGPEDAYEPQDRPPRAHDSTGAARHAMDKGRTLHEQEEDNFLRRLCDRINAAAAHRQFEHLAIAAPPRALGRIRALLAPAALAKLRADLAKDILHESGSALRERLQALLR
jgi:protein required for attachment to host cells